MGMRADPLPAAWAPPVVREVPVDRPLQWLRAGWDDVRALRGRSLAYGVFVAGTGVALLLLTLAGRGAYLVPAYIGGFLLVAPFVAIGLYALSRQRERGEAANTRSAVFAWRANTTSIGLFGLVLALALLGWERLSAIIFALFYGGTVPQLDRMVRDVLFSGDYLPLAIAWVGSGALLAAAVFTFAVISAPLLLDRPLDVVTACLTSLRCCLRNPPAMVVWAALIAALTLLGFATAMLGLVVIFPWLSHASWHAYRDLVE